MKLLIDISDKDYEFIKNAQVLISRIIFCTRHHEHFAPSDMCEFWRGGEEG